MPLQISRRCVVNCDGDDPYHRTAVERRIDGFSVSPTEQDRASTKDWISAVLGTGRVERDRVADVLAFAKDMVRFHRAKGEMAYLVADILRELCPEDFDWQSLRTLKESDSCKVCLDAVSDVFTLPCQHLLMCLSCSGRTARCPLCRCLIEMKMSECQIPDGIRVYRA
ncbi:baculoviral IAP repeat-containing protein 3-like [Anneissia japonica]|uniref:baculoviral IAP repeat-containing protein 3-like n=1 Tax=Anneissia japonica TaxID=1529436 RepID=UPI001425780B|nr:baculoviral IAP repeat-containing protein 3-like [Anneissia japonica]